MTNHRILVIHPERSYRDHCRVWLEREGYEVELSADAFEERLSSEGFDLVLVAASPPVATGLDALRDLRASDAGMPAVIVTEPTELPVRMVSQAVQLGAVDVVRRTDKPEVLLESISNAIDHHAIGAMRGDLRDLGLSSLISMICNEGRRAALEIRHGEQVARVFFERGEITHAEVGDKVGEPALYDVLAWHEGSFVMHTGEGSPEVTIHANWTGLVLEGLRRADEAEFDQEQLTPEMTSTTVDTFEWGEEAEEMPPAPRGPSFDLDEASQARVYEYLDRLYRSLQPRCVLLTDGSGRLLHLQGDVERSRALSLAALIAGSFSATREIAEIIAHADEIRRFQQSLQEGVDFSLYSAQAGDKWTLAVAFEPDRTVLGLARQLTLRAASELATISAEATQAPSEEADEVAEALGDLFRQEVGDALEDLFD